MFCKSAEKKQWSQITKQSDPGNAKDQKATPEGYLKGQVLDSSPAPYSQGWMLNGWLGRSLSQPSSLTSFFSLVPRAIVMAGPPLMGRSVPLAFLLLHASILLHLLWNWG